MRIICPEASEDDDSVIEDITAQDDFLQLVACMSRETDTCPWSEPPSSLLRSVSSIFFVSSLILDLDFDME